MARIQILELPSEEGDDGKTITPFALILDEFDVDESGPPFGIEHFAERCGARAFMISSMTIETPGLTADEIATINRPLMDGMREFVDAAFAKHDEAVMRRLREGARP